MQITLTIGNGTYGFASDGEHWWESVTDCISEEYAFTDEYGDSVLDLSDAWLACWSSLYEAARKSRNDVTLTVASGASITVSVL